MTEAELLALAERALGHVEGEAQATALHRRTLVAGRVEEVVRVALASVRDGRVGVAATTTVGDAGLSGLARAAEAATATSSVGDYPGLPAPAAGRGHDGWDPAVARLLPDPALRIDEAVAERSAIVSSTGVRVAEGRSWVRRGDRVAARLAGLDGGTAAPDGDARDLGRLPAGPVPVVLAPAAVAHLLEALGRTAFDGLAFARGLSPLTGRLGTRVAASAINLSESPRFPGTLPRSYDAEGVPVQPLPLIQDGVAHRVVHDTRSAALAGGGATSTGHARSPGGNPLGPAARNLVLVGGGATDEAELLAAVASGAYVAAFDDLHALDAGGAVVSALARGRIVRDGVPAERFAGARLHRLAARRAGARRGADDGPGAVPRRDRLPSGPRQRAGADGA